MLKVFYGDDVVTVRHEAMQAVELFCKAGYTSVSYSAEDYLPSLVNNSLQAGSLFGTKAVVVFDNPSANKEFYDEVVAVVSDLQTSVLPFVIIEQKLLAIQLRVFTKVGAEIYEAKKTVLGKFNTFALADALLTRDKKLLWILLQKAHQEAIEEESIIGILWWQLKTLRLTYLTKNATEAGVKDFPYNKAKRAQSKFPLADVEALSFNLLKVYHDGHNGKNNMTIALEKWVLSI